MKTIISKYVVAWGDALIHDVLFNKIREKLNGPRTKGDEYSSKYDYGIYDTKKTQIDIGNIGNASRDIGGTPGENGAAPEPTSGYQMDQKIYGDQPVNDEAGPGYTRKMPETDPNHVQLVVDNPTTINSLFQSETTDRDKGTSAKTRGLLKDLHNEPNVRPRRRYDVDSFTS